MSAPDDEAEVVTERRGIRAVVLTGTGDRAFCAGLDLRAFATGLQPTPDQQRGMDAFGQFLSGTGGCAEPVIGAAQATALAGGLEMYLARRIPLAQALELTLTGEPITPAQALNLGLVNAIVPAEQVLDRALGSEDAKEGTRAFIERRAPVWPAS